MKFGEGLYQDDINRVVANVPNIDKLFGQRVFVTGSTGLICSAVVDVLFYLNAHHDANIHIYLGARNRKSLTERFSYKRESADFFFVDYDSTRSVEIQESFDYIIHGASNADPKRIISQPVETIMSNIIGLSCLLDSIKVNQKGRLLFVSSSEVYGQKDNNNPYRETDYGYVDILNPRACYPTSKRAAENMCVSYANEHGIDVVIARPGHVYGPTMKMTDSRASSQFPRDVISGSDIVMKSEGLQMRSYCYVLDCASALLSVLINGCSGEAYNISNKESVCSIRDMAEAFAVAGNKRIVFELPSEAERKSFNLMSNSSLEAAKLESLGWKAVFSMQEGAKHTIEILKSE